MRYFSEDLSLLGIVTAVYPADAQFELQCRSGDTFRLAVTGQTSVVVLSNLDNGDYDRVPEPRDSFADGSAATKLVNKYVRKGAMLVVQGILQEHDNRPDGSPNRWIFARVIHLLGQEPGRYNFENTQWWLSQIGLLADRWLDMLFGDKRSYRPDDFAEFYQTDWNIIGLPGDRNVQETATLSRLIYGLSSAYLLLGDERYYRAAKAGVEYQRETFRMVSHDGTYCFWAFGKQKLMNNQRKIIEPSQNEDDRGSVPLYEQIYALAGLTQYYRITGDWEVLEDIRMTIASFNAFYLGPLVGDDVEKRRAREDPLWGFYSGFFGGYFSHLDQVTRRYDSEALDRYHPNRSRKNWNSVGDHIPAYLTNLVLALDPLPLGRDDLAGFAEECKRMLVATSQIIVDRFPDPESPYVNERFHADWTPDHSWYWQQNRAIVGHNLKIAWNLTRVANYFKYVASQEGKRGHCREGEAWLALADKTMAAADRLGQDMIDAGMDQFRGGCFDAVERQPSNGMPIQFSWGNTKDFWQQEQAVLAYLILCGCSTQEDWCDEYLKLARETAAVWNLFFLDRDNIGIRFRITDTGDPVIEGSYAEKGGHSISGYHAFELNYLAHIYTRAYVTSKDGDEAAFCLYFRPDADNRGQRSINVLPDFFEPGELVVSGVSVNGVRRSEESFCPDDFRIRLEEEELGSTVVVDFRTRRPGERAGKPDGAACRPEPG